MSDKEKLNTDEVAFPELTPESIEMPAVTEVAQTTIGEEVLTEEEVAAEIVASLEEEDDLNKKTYLMISPTFYVKSTRKEEGEDKDLELYKVFNPETNVVERRELTDDEKREVIIYELKDARKVFKPVKHNGNKTTNQFDSKFKQKRKRRNSLTKKSRKANR